jgi:hypothetical protein
MALVPFGLLPPDVLDQVLKYTIDDKVFAAIYLLYSGVLNLL